MATVNRHGHAAGQQIAKRLDVLGHLQSGCFGVSWWFVRVFFVAGGVWAMAAAHSISFAYLVNSLESDFPMSKSERAVTGGMISLGTFVGAFFFGNLADLRGRKFALLIAFVIAHTATALSAAAHSVEVFGMLRFVVGIGLGGEQPIIVALIMELAPANIRGRALVYLDAFSAVGSMLTVLLCRDLEPLIGWRVLFLCNIAALLYLPLIYYFIPESPKWLANAGHYQEAVTVLRSIEQASSVFHGEEADDAIYSLQVDNNSTAVLDVRHSYQEQELPLVKAVVNRARILLRYPYLTRTLMLWVVWTGMSMSNTATFVYLGEDFLRNVLDRHGETLVVYLSMVAQLLGNLSAAALIDRIGRRYTLIAFLMLASCGSLLEVYLDPTKLSVLLSSCLRNFGFMGAWGCLYAYTPELYPITVRVVGISYAWGISRLGAFAGPFTVVLLAERFQFSTPVVMWVFCGVSLSAAVVIYAFGIETASFATEEDKKKNRSLTADHRQTSAPSHVVAYAKHEDDKIGATRTIFV